MRVLVLCTGNSARSQMAEAFLRNFDPAIEAHSAGTDPAAEVNPHAVEVMREVGVDLSGSRPKPVTDYLGQVFDFVITVCAEADRNCPVFTGSVRRRVHLPFEDPARATGSNEQVRAVFRRVRDQIRDRLLDFYEKEIRPQL